jgi:predicted GNAT superfamily acetyltransferase
LCDAAIDRLCPLKLTIFYSETQNSDVTNFVYFQPMYMRIVLVLRILVSRQLCGAPVSSALLGTFSSFFAHGVVELIRFVSLFYGSK